MDKTFLLTFHHALQSERAHRWIMNLLPRKHAVNYFNWARRRMKWINGLYFNAIEAIFHSLCLEYLKANRAAVMCRYFCKCQLCAICHLKCFLNMRNWIIFWIELTDIWHLFCRCTVFSLIFQWLDSKWRLKNVSALGDHNWVAK